MKKVIFLLAIAFLSSAASAQKRKKTVKAPAVPTMELARQAMSAYDFARAEDLLTKEIAALNKKKQSADQAERMLHAARQGRTKLHATERMVIIDSIVCAPNEALELIRISRENGRIDTYASTYHTNDTLGATIFENELANKRYLAVPKAVNDSVTSLCLAVSDKIGNDWSEPTILTGLNDNDTKQNYPFLLSDGITLYYAAKGPESMGGYDIFVSRADGEDGSFLSPENIGFPYNSPANDYLLVIDEFNQLGWFISDRYQPDNQVCVYSFMPNATRELYGDEVSEEQLRSLARIASLKDTWAFTLPNNVQEARKRLADIRTVKKESSNNNEEQFQFVIDDNRTYASLDNFKSTAARDKMKRWLILQKNNETDATMLERMRDLYATSSDEQRKQLQVAIQRLEDSYYDQSLKLKQLAKEIRNDEISNK
jgi:hypothetical protein